ncbi:asparagine synthase [Natronococcus pandeyae]|uniref:Asparagine synthase n=1 Tax=Natronococcus pandeyae TaxID=2055836 RepID=A0A8J8TS63_9EURY|nr:asparagine synthase-related protein [Natronococcus pandeyae]TYL38424.1 asparagine synthase [Natronococcus pandeyae]
MVGVCGAFGGNRPGIDPIPAWIDRDGAGERARHDGSALTGFAATHRRSSQPISVPERNATLLVFGSVYSRIQDGSSDRRPTGVSTPAYCAQEYAADGIDALTELNGEFVAVVVDHEGRTLRFVTDLLGSQPVYYSLDREWLLFSTSAQSLVHHPDVAAAFDPDSLVEYLTHKSVRGVETPFAGVKQLPPASITTVDFADPEPIEHERYWNPVLQPTSQPVDRFVDQFVDRFTAATEDRIRSGRRHGLLLSGGSDSRLLAATVDPERAYGFTTGSSMPADESTVAARVARTVGVPFTRFELGADRYPELLEEYGRHGNAIGWFNEGRTLTVTDAVREEVDTLVSGLYADVFFKGWSLPHRRLSTPVGSVSLPLERRIEDQRQYLQTRSEETPAYVDTDDVPSAHRVLEQSLVETSDGVRDHGIDYPSVAELGRTGFWFPLTNETSFDRYGDTQVLPTVYPFLDRRLIELSLRLPRTDAMRHNVVNRAVSRIAPDLAAIPHNESGVSLSRPRLLHWFGQLYGDQFRNSGGGTNADTLRGDWLPEFVRARESTIRALPGIDYGEAHRLCREHVDGADHTAALCGLVSVLAMPATRTITGTEPVADSVPRVSR